MALSVRQLLRPHHGRKRLAITLVAGVATVWTVGLIDFAARIPAGVDDGETPTDAIVVLTGGSKRVEAGLALLLAGRAERMFVSGVHADVRLDELIALAPTSPDALRCCVEAGRAATNTAENAVETAAWMRANGFSSLRLVTSSYHMPRSLTEFAMAIPEAEVVPHPVFADEVKTEQWWKWPGTAALIVSEYNKSLVTRMRSVMAIVTGEHSRGLRTAAK